MHSRNPFELFLLRRLCILQKQFTVVNWTQSWHEGKYTYTVLMSNEKLITEEGRLSVLYSGRGRGKVHLPVMLSLPTMMWWKVLFCILKILFTPNMGGNLSIIYPHPTRDSHSQPWDQEMQTPQTDTDRPRWWKVFLLI